MGDLSLLIDWLQKKMGEEDVEMEKHSRSRSEESPVDWAESHGRWDAFGEVLSFVVAMDETQKVFSEKDPKAP